MRGSAKCVCSVFLCLILLGLSLPAAAQGKADLGVGYNFQRISDPHESENLPGGWVANLAVNLTDMFAVVGEVTGNYKTIEGTKAKVHLFSGGVQVRPKGTAKAKPFVRVMVGDANLSASECSECGDNNVHFQVGGGVSCWTSPRLGVEFFANFIRITGDADTNALGMGATLLIH